jgi:hypothetical protein
MYRNEQTTDVLNRDWLIAFFPVAWDVCTNFRNNIVGDGNVSKPRDIEETDKASKTAHLMNILRKQLRFTSLFPTFLFHFSCLQQKRDYSAAQIWWTDIFPSYFIAMSLIDATKWNRCIHVEKLKRYCFPAVVRFRKWNINILHSNISVASLLRATRSHVNASYICFKVMRRFLKFVGCTTARLKMMELYTEYSCRSQATSTIRHSVPGVYYDCNTLITYF